jgi:hypothetical protein
MPASEFYKNSRAVAFRGAQVRLPDATRSAAHSIVHDALDHESYLRGTVELRRLLDLVMIRVKYEPRIDWAELDCRFSAAGFGPALATTLSFAERLFGLPVPRIVQSARQHKAKRRAERWGQIARMPRDYVAARSRDPWGVFNLFKPRTWPARIYRMRVLLGPGSRSI